MPVLLLSLFVLSGFSALVYQSMWTHYLGLILGHAAHAQTLVLVLFMGGMALGAWWVSRVTRRLRSLVGAYAGVELLIGIAGLGFHAAFLAFSAWSETRVLPALQGSALAPYWPWLGAGALIAVQTVLLGATFPLMAGGLLRLHPEARGATLGGLYFTNGLGAAAGALAASFVLLPRLGLPGSLQAAAAINMVLAAATAAVAWRWREPWQAAPGGVESKASPDTCRLARTLMLATGLSSAASFGYEIGWVRLLNQALGTTLHGFELMLAAFILGLALGGLWVRKCGDHITDVVRYAGLVQLWMGLCALLSLPVLASSYAWVGWLSGALARSESGYELYSLATIGIALIVMAPAAFLAGMTLPLFTTALLRRGAGEGAIGAVYAANTVGAIGGVILVVHVLIPSIGVSLSIATAALLDALIGVWLLRGVSPKRWTPAIATAALGVLATAGLVLRLGLPSALHQASGVFRTGSLDPARLGHLDYFRDGSTATVSVRLQADHTAVISTNGKPDAGMRDFAADPTSDEITMVMLGAAPLAWHPAPRLVAVIGWGSGLSTHTLLGSPAVQQVDTIEIERAMWEGAKSFLPRNRLAYEDPRSVMRFDDARTFFATQARRYDVIVSEPSNPWVAGVASLFTKEFYAQARRSMAPDGLFVQWIHAYEMTDAILAEMLAALLLEFPHAEVFITNTNDFIVLGRAQPPAELPASHMLGLWQHAGLAAEMQRVGLSSPADLQVRRLGGAALLRSFVRQHAVKPHSDFFPTVALAAPKARFQGQEARQLPQVVLSGLPILNALECKQPQGPEVVVTRSRLSSLARAHLDARAAAQALGSSGDVTLELDASDAELARDIRLLRAQLSGGLKLHAESFHRALAHLANSTVAHLDLETAKALWNDHRLLGKLPPEAPQWLREQLGLYAAWTRSDWARVQAHAAALLDADKAPIAPQVRHAALVYGMLAGMASGDRGAVARWERSHGHRVPAQLPKAVRQLLAAWDGHEVVCAVGR